MKKIAEIIENNEFRGTQVQIEGFINSILSFKNAKDEENSIKYVRHMDNVPRFMTDVFKEYIMALKYVGAKRLCYSYSANCEDIRIDHDMSYITHKAISVKDMIQSMMNNNMSDETALSHITNMPKTSIERLVKEMMKHNIDDKVMF